LRFPRFLEEESEREREKEKEKEREIERKPELRHYRSSFSTKSSRAFTIGRDYVTTVCKFFFADILCNYLTEKWHFDQTNEM